MLEHIVASADDNKVTEAFVKSIGKHHNDHLGDQSEEASNKAAQEERRAKAGQLETDVKFSTPSKQEQMHELIEHIVEQEKKKLNPRFKSPIGAHDWYKQNGDHPNIDAWKADSEKAHKEIHHTIVQERLRLDNDLTTRRYD